MTMPALLWASPTGGCFVHESGALAGTTMPGESGFNDVLAAAALGSGTSSGASAPAAEAALGDDLHEAEPPEGEVAAAAFAMPSEPTAAPAPAPTAVPLPAPASPAASPASSPTVPPVPMAPALPMAVAGPPMDQDQARAAHDTAADRIMAPGSTALPPPVVGRADGRPFGLRAEDPHGRGWEEPPAPVALAAAPARTGAPRTGAVALSPGGGPLETQPERTHGASGDGWSASGRAEPGRERSAALAASVPFVLMAEPSAGPRLSARLMPAPVPSAHAAGAALPQGSPALAPGAGVSEPAVLGVEVRPAAGIPDRSPPPIELSFSVRDRASAAWLAGEAPRLVDQLGRMGTEVDAIHVERSPERSDDLGRRGGADDGRHQHAGAQSDRREPWGPSAGRADGWGLSTATGGEPSSGPPSDRAPKGGSGAAPAEQGPASEEQARPGRRARIDRYA